MQKISNEGKLIVIVAPSGAGKSTLILRLKKEFPNLKESISYTTRPMRAGEIHGKNYFFIEEEKFKKMIEKKEFIEWAKVHSHYYGTSKKFVQDGLINNEILLFDLDVQGADNVKKFFNSQAHIIFIAPPSISALENRLRKRGTDAEAVIVERLKNAESELKRQNDYDYLVLNDHIDTAFGHLKEIVSNIVMKGRFVD